jgi:hypothetical protein
MKVTWVFLNGSCVNKKRHCTGTAIARNVAESVLKMSLFQFRAYPARLLMCTISKGDINIWCSVTFPCEVV